MNKYLTELHLHTKESSSCSEIPAKQMIEKYKKEGYSTIVITDHCSKSKMDRLGDISWIEKIYEYTLEELYKLCNKKGYLLIQAHPFRDDIQLAPLEYIDGIEVFNGCQDEISRNDKALEYGKNTNKILTSGSDFHRLGDLAEVELELLQK